MKLFIIEGPDNTGKSHFANALEMYLKNNGYKNISYIHFDAPKAPNYKDAANIEHQFSMQIAKKLRNMQTQHKYDAVILDRSWYSEFVYGHLYRHRTQADCLEKIRVVEDIIINSFDEGDTYYVYMTASPKFLINHEDGKSLSNSEIDFIKKEIKMFDLLYNNVMLDNLITLNVEDENGNYIDVQTQLEKVIKF